MIHIHRGSEPPGLAPVRTQEIARLRQIPSPTSDEVGRKYRAFAGVLRQAQHYKCCYCEAYVQEGFNDVEHYRPKARADRRPGSKDVHGYWWLAWTWDNLLFSCPGCNRSGKNDRFPLAAGSVALVAEELPPGREKPLLIDPAAPEGGRVAMIRFVTVRLPNGDERWIPEARGGEERGRATIDVLALDRDELLDLYEVHYQRLEPMVADIRVAMNANDRQMVKREWQRAMRELRPFCEFIGLTHDIFDQCFPAELRARWDLNLPDVEQV